MVINSNHNSLHPYFPILRNIQREILICNGIGDTVCLIAIQISTTSILTSLDKISVLLKNEEEKKYRIWVSHYQGNILAEFFIERL